MNGKRDITAAYENLVEKNKKLEQQVTLLSGVFSREEELNVHLRSKNLEIDKLKILLREVFDTVNIEGNSYLCLQIMKALE